MTVSRRVRTALALAALGLLVAPAVGCVSQGSEERAPEVAPPPVPPAPVATPAPPLPPPRSDGARIADEESVRTLTQGETTKAEVRARFGTPQEIVFSPGVETFIYYRDKCTGWLSCSPERVEMLTIHFDLKGVVKDYEYRLAGK